MRNQWNKVGLHVSWWLLLGPALDKRAVTTWEESCHLECCGGGGGAFFLHPSLLCSCECFREKRQYYGKWNRSLKDSLAHLGVGVRRFIDFDMKALKPESEPLISLFRMCVLWVSCARKGLVICSVYCDGSWKERGILKGVGRIHAECVTLKLKWKKQTLLGTYLVLQWLNTPASAGNTGSAPGPGTKIPHATGELSLGTPCATTKTWHTQINKY